MRYDEALLSLLMLFLYCWSSGLSFTHETLIRVDHGQNHSKFYQHGRKDRNSYKSIPDGPGGWSILEYVSPKIAQAMVEWRGRGTAENRYWKHHEKAGHDGWRVFSQ